MARPHILLRVAMFVVWLALVVLCGLAYSGKLGKLTIDGVSENKETPLTPKGYTYYALVVIAAVEGFGCVYALLPWGYEGPKKDRWKAKTVNAVGAWWILGFICQILWLVLWVQDIGATYILAFSVQIAGFTSFAICYGILMGMTSKKKSGQSVSALSYISLYIPTIMNLAWLTIASCIGFFTVLHHFHPGNSNSDQIVATLLAAAVTFAGLLVEGFHVSVFFGLTLLWTFIGIYINNRNAVDDNGEKIYEFMEQGILVCLILLSQMTLWSIVVSIFRFCRPADEKEIPLTSSSSDEEEEGQVASSEKPVMV